MCDERRGVADRGLEGRETESGVTARDRGLSRGVGSRAGGAPVTAVSGRQGEVPHAYLNRVENVGRWVRERERVLENLTSILRRTAPQALSDPSLATSARELGRHEEEFRQLMARSDPNPIQPDGPRQLAARDRPRALQLLDRARDATQWNDARESFWRAVYNDPAGRRYVDVLRRAGRLRISDYAMRQGYAPKILDFDDRGRPHFRTSPDIDHIISRERVPFYAYRPDNLRLQTPRYNRVWLGGLSGASPFPMGRGYGEASDEIEDFVQANRLSRRQRPLSERVRRAGRASTAIGALLLTVFAASSAEALRTRADEYRRARIRRRAAARRRQSIEQGDIEVYNVTQMIQRVFELPPAELDLTLANQFRQAAEHWIRRDYRERGAGFRQFEDRLRAAEGNTDGLNQLLEEVGHPSMRDWTGLVFGDLSRVPSAASHVQDARRLANALLQREDEYLRQAQGFEELSRARPDAIRETVPEFAIDLDVLMTLHDEARDESNRYSGYVQTLRRALQLLNEARDALADRFRRIEEEMTLANEALARGTGGR